MSTLLSGGIPLFAKLNSSIYKAASLAREIVNELIQDLKIRPCPIIFASFSGGPKACMYKIIEGKCDEGQINPDKCRLHIRFLSTGFLASPPPRTLSFLADSNHSALNIVVSLMLPEFLGSISHLMLGG
ncbi:hypothetical protein AAHA92_24795 [Salvia divinorum]|uniref:Uncharacterized protein n=1 Tax=Salvia divinorum TaxID=28513 RepID=A0ABD1G8I7_SALDI